MNINLKIILILLLFLTSALYAQKRQGKALSDSLLVELPKTGEDTNRVNLLCSISKLQFKSAEGIKYAVEALKLATKLDWKPGLFLSNNQLSVCYDHASDYVTALKYNTYALKYAEVLGNKKYMAKALNNKAIIYVDQSNYPVGLDFYMKSLKISESIGDSMYIVFVSGNIGNLYKRLGKYQEALNFEFRAVEIANAMGSLFGKSITFGNIGEIYIEQKNYSKALDYLQKALTINKKIDNKSEISYNLADLARTYTSLNDYTKALDYFSQALQLKKEIGNRKDEAEVYNNMGGLYAKMKNYSMAIGYEQKALAIASEINAQRIIKESLKNLAETYTSAGDYKKALYYTNEYHIIKDTIFTKDNGQKLVRLEVQNQYDRQHLSDSLRAAQKEQLVIIHLNRQRNYTYMGIAGIILLLVFSFFIARERGKSEKQKKIAQDERKKSDTLLLNILPSEIAEELKLTGGSKAQYYDNVTVLFTDFVDFTKAGERMTPQALVDELDTCFKAFDNITNKYNIEKIKTIGDAYLAVCGLPKTDSNHAEKVVKAAIEIRDLMLSRKAQLGDNTFEVRIGVHSGNVVAGIVGVKKFAYDIWGDTVNTAARMEQNSEAGKVNISETTYELVKDKFTSTYRGEIEAKNKGMLQMYFVEGLV